MYLEERLSFIKNVLEEKNRVNVKELAKKLDVSEVTIRKDLKELESLGLVKRTYGGAIKLSKNVEELTLESKKTINIEFKKRIAKKASGLIENSYTIFLDSGTTTRMLVDYLNKFEDLIVITYDLEIALSLAKYSNIKTYILGGYIEHKTNTALSIDGYNNLASFHADICFMGTDAYDSNYAYSTSENKGHIKSRMIENSKVSVLLADTSKYPSTGLYSFAKIENFDYFITEKNK